MSDIQLVQEGDIITSPEFVIGEYASKSVEYVTDAGLKVRDMVADVERPITVGLAYKSHVVCFRHAETVDGFSRDVEHELDVDATDESRGTARFRVTVVEMCGGGTGHGDHDVYPEGWHVTAVRVDADNPETIQFYQTGCFNCIVKAPEILGNVMDKTGVGFEVGLKLNADYIKYLRLKKKYASGFDR